MRYETYANSLGRNALEICYSLLNQEESFQIKFHNRAMYLSEFERQFFFQFPKGYLTIMLFDI